MFYELNGQKAEVFDNEIIPSIPVKQGNDFYRSFKLHSPVAVLSKSNEIDYEYKDSEENKLSKNLVFSHKPTISDIEVENKRNNKSMKNIRKTAVEFRLNIEYDVPKTKKIGRAKGSKNKKR